MDCHWWNRETRTFKIGGIVLGQGKAIRCTRYSGRSWGEGSGKWGNGLTTITELVTYKDKLVVMLKYDSWKNC